jgi:hypothetical protein
MTSWNFAPATSGHTAVKIQKTSAVPLTVRNCVDDLMQMYGPSKQMAVSSTGTVNADGTGTVTITVTAT